MSNLAFFAHDFNDHQVRVTSDRRFSVYDVLVAFKCYPNIDTARITFGRIKNANSEVSTFCSDFKFPGQALHLLPSAAQRSLLHDLGGV